MAVGRHRTARGQAVSFDESVETRPRDAEQASRLPFVAAGAIQDALDVGRFHGVQRVRRPPGPLPGLYWPGGCQRDPIHADHRSSRQHGSPREGVLQLSDVAGPVVRLQILQRFFSDPVDPLVELAADLRQ